MRDYGFLTVQSTGGAELMDFRFNGWGGKFKAEHDNAANKLLYATNLVRGHYVDALDFELEGGGIESDGCGTLLTTGRMFVQSQPTSSRRCSANIR